jgi:glycosyltransferase involved in cell wall biosynthesis
VKLSLVVCTIGRPDDLQRLIDSLEIQAGPRVDLSEWELLVVDQSGQPETGELLARQNSAMTIRHLPMPGRGAARARNYGWSFARGELITFPDDDCHYPAGFLEQVLQLFDDVGVDALQTQCEFIGKQDDFGGPITRQNVLQRCVEAALFARRERLGDVRYDEMLGVGSHTPWNSDEGPDLLLRMLERGLRIDYHPELVIHHPNPLQTQDEGLQQRNLKYSRGRGYLLRKHRFPWPIIAKTMIRSLGGSLLKLLSGQPYWARYYWNSFVGKWQGLRGGKNAPPQLLTSPLSSVADPADATSAR